MGMELRVARSVFAAIEADARRRAPLECCGILLGRDGAVELAVPAANVAADGSTRFEIDPQALIDAHRAARAGGREVIGYYHSHPAGPAEPSAADRAEASGDGRVWAIAGRDGITFWCDGKSGFERLSCDSFAG